MFLLILSHNDDVYPVGVRDRDEGSRPERPLSAAPKLPTGSPASGDVEEIHPMGKEQPAAY